MLHVGALYFIGNLQNMDTPTFSFLPLQHTYSCTDPLSLKLQGSIKCCSLYAFPFLPSGHSWLQGPIKWGHSYFSFFPLEHSYSCTNPLSLILQGSIRGRGRLGHGEILSEFFLLCPAVKGWDIGSVAPHSLYPHTNIFLVYLPVKNKPLNDDFPNLNSIAYW